MHKDHARQLTYKGTLFKAPNVKEKPYYVAAIKDGKVLWEINNDALPPERQSSALKDGGIEKIVIQTVKESDLDSGAEYFEQVKKYVGKPALYVYYSKDTVINKLPSWLIVDVATGRKIGFIAFN